MLTNGENDVIVDLILNNACFDRSYRDSVSSAPPRFIYGSFVSQFPSKFLRSRKKKESSSWSRKRKLEITIVRRSHCKMEIRVIALHGSTKRTKGVGRDRSDAHCSQAWRKDEGGVEPRTEFSTRFHEPSARHTYVHTEFN